MWSEELHQLSEAPEQGRLFRDSLSEGIRRTTISIQVLQTVIDTDRWFSYYLVLLLYEEEKRLNLCLVDGETERFVQGSGNPWW